MSTSELVKATKYMANNWGNALQARAQNFAPRHIAPHIMKKVSQLSEGIWDIRLWVQKVDKDKFGTKDAYAQEYGSGVHDPKGAHLIPIVPKNAPNLVFISQNPKVIKAIGGKYSDGLIITKKVLSPGIGAYNSQGYIRPAIKEWRLQIKKDTPQFATAIKADIRKTLGKSFVRKSK